MECVCFLSVSRYPAIFMKRFEDCCQNDKGDINRQEYAVSSNTATSHVCYVKLVGDYRSSVFMVSCWLISVFYKGVFSTEIDSRTCLWVLVPSLGNNHLVAPTSQCECFAPLSLHFHSCKGYLSMTYAENISYLFIV